MQILVNYMLKNISRECDIPFQICSLDQPVKWSGHERLVKGILFLLRQSQMHLKYLQYFDSVYIAPAVCIFLGVQEVNNGGKGHEGCMRYGLLASY
jgi:hypothetical protein